MSPSLRNLTPEYVKSRMKNAKLPLSTSGRFKAKVKARLPDRIRTLAAELRDLLEDEFKDAKLRLADERHAKSHRKRSSEAKEKVLASLPNRSLDAALTYSLGLPASRSPKQCSRC